MTPRMATAMFDIVCSATGDKNTCISWMIKLDISLADVLMLPKYVRMVFINKLEFTQ